MILQYNTIDFNTGFHASKAWARCDSCAETRRVNVVDEGCEHERVMPNGWIAGTVWVDGSYKHRLYCPCCARPARRDGFAADKHYAHEFARIGRFSLGLCPIADFFYPAEGHTPSRPSDYGVPID